MTAMPQKSAVGSAINPEAIYSESLEKAVLGCMLAQPDEVIDDVIRVLDENDFFVPAHQEIFKALADLHEHANAIDVLTVHNYLDGYKVLGQSMAAKCGSPGILGEILTTFSSHLNVRSYVKEVKDKSLLRKLQKACQTITKDIIAMPDSVKSLMERAEATIFAQVGNVQSTEKPFFQSIQDTTTEIIEWSNKGGGLKGYPTGFSKLDDILSGWRGDQLIVIGGGMGVGKTALALTFARALLEKDIPGGMFSQEMGAKQLDYRMLSGKARIASRGMMKGTLAEDQRLTLREVSEDIKHWPFYVDCTQGLDIQQIRSRARRWKRMHNIQWIIIDYIQLTRSRKFQASKVAEVSDIAINLKEMAKELNITVFGLSQLNTDAGEIPSKTSVKDSKVIAEAADVLLLMHLDKENEEFGGHSKNYILNVAKNRDGMEDIRFNIEYQAWCTNFREPLRLA